MAAIAGVSKENSKLKVSAMLSKMSHRGAAKKTLLEKEGTTVGITWNDHEDKNVTAYLTNDIVCDYKRPGHFAWAKPEDGLFTLYRDELGVTPLYYGWDSDDTFYFASEVKALVSFVESVKELLPGNTFNGREMKEYFQLGSLRQEQVSDPVKTAYTLKSLLDDSVKFSLNADRMGSWLSGGLDSSAICAIASQYINPLVTFAAGVEGAPDLEYARMAADYLGTEHHEVIVSLQEMLSALPEVIYHLESFDALLVRSSITNYLAAKEASQYVSEVFSGEGGDELFAGYEYLKALPRDLLPYELTKITGDLHNTALQRVDRCSSAFGTTAHTPFLDPDVVKYAFSIPVGYKLNGTTEKWILRKALDGHLPEPVLNRPKAKFWEGAGVKELVSSYAEDTITDSDFSKNRLLPNGWNINTKEELLYYYIFKEHFGSEIDLSWIGRTEGSPVK